jgi:uncharacterized membrane protein YhaH (DUF805 family)
MGAYFDALRRYFKFSGRTTAKQYWLFVLISLALLALAFYADTLVFDGDYGLGDFPNNLGPFALFVFLFHVIPSITTQVRRLHDVDKSGWWSLVTFVPLGALWLLTVYCRPSTYGANRYGPAVDATQRKTATVSSTTDQSRAPVVKIEVDKLEKLAALRASGAINEFEFQKMKEKLISGWVE